AYLEGLEQDYSVLAPYVLLRRLEAYSRLGNTEQVEATLQALRANYPQSPAVADALYQLGGEYWETAIAQFPKHPRTHQIIRQRLKQNPNSVELLKILAKYDADAPDVKAIRDRLVNQYASQLTPEDWEAIAKGYWDTWQYGKAGKAYSKAPRTPENLYRAGRGLHLGGERQKAREFYQTLINAFPDAEDTPLALRRLASLSSNSQALSYLDRVIENYPTQAGQALVEKANILDKLNSSQSAAQARELLLTQYASSDAAAEYRWNRAEKLGQQGKILEAWQWAHPITENNRDSSIAAEAAFWIGKWAAQLGKQDDARQSFEYVLRHHPQSYYAWRSAVLLGLDVGNFNSVRNINPQVNKPEHRPLLPAGSDSLRELYQLGQDSDAIALWRTELTNNNDLSVTEQFTDGLIRTASGKYLTGINQIWYLKDRQKPEEIAQWQTLRQQPDYWYGLFPLPYYDAIANWSQQRQVNPLLVISLMRQESRFEKEIRSVAGATGLMQVMPGTGQWVASKINLANYSLTNPEDSINLGTWYLGYTHDEYDNHSLLAVASYNAGPGNVAKWLRQYNISDPDLFIEKIPFSETKGYVEAVFGNYWNYLRLYNPEVAQMMAQYQK
ncbi:MAG: transglycosylase SLT domain-containing protein, partial [Cyanobacteriota bacterium]